MGARRRVASAIVTSPLSIRPRSEAEEAWAVWKRVQIDRKPDPSLLRTAGAALITGGVVAGAMAMARLMSPSLPPHDTGEAGEASAEETQGKPNAEDGTIIQADN